MNSIFLYDLVSKEQVCNETTVDSRWYKVRRTGPFSPYYPNLVLNAVHYLHVHVYTRRHSACTTHMSHKKNYTHSWTLLQYTWDCTTMVWIISQWSFSICDHRWCCILIASHALGLISRLCVWSIFVHILQGSYQRYHGKALHQSHHVRRWHTIISTLQTLGHHNCHQPSREVYDRHKGITNERYGQLTTNSNSTKTKQRFSIPPCFINARNLPPISIGRTPVAYCNEARSLGVVFDSELRLRTHVGNICRACGLSPIRSERSEIIWTKQRPKSFYMLASHHTLMAATVFLSVFLAQTSKGSSFCRIMLPV